MADELVNLKIDGITTAVKKGTNVLEAARALGIDISYFCYHPGLSSPAVCRQCLVEVKGQPKLVPSCYTPVAENMEVTTASPRVLDVRRQMLEFTLLNHPADCPICDKAGECTLQKLYQEWDGKHARIDHQKVHKPKAVDLGPQIVLDAERCILCTRCIRVCDEVAHDHQLEMKQRGDHEELSVAPGRRLDNPYSLNTVDVCPVGALTSKDFRFQMRAWELYATPSVCPGCATGCNIEIHHAQGEAWRLVPRPNMDVNHYWMCDEGRFTYKEIASPGRVVGAQLSGDPATLDATCAWAAARIKAARDAGTLAVVFGAQATNEDLFVARQLVEKLGNVTVYIAGRAPVPAREDKILRSADVNPNSAGAKSFASINKQAPGDIAALEKAILESRLSTILFIGEDVAFSSAALDPLSRLDTIVQATHNNPLTEIAKAILPAASWAEVDGTFTNRQGRVQRIRRALEPRGGSRPHWELTLALARKLDIELDHGVAAPQLTARHVFQAMKAANPELAGVEWGKPLPLVQLRFQHSRG